MKIGPRGEIRRRYRFPVVERHKRGGLKLIPNANYDSKTGYPHKQTNVKYKKTTTVP